MEIIKLLISAVLGGIFSWLITHIYSKKTLSDQEIIFSKLSDNLKKTILYSKAKNLTVKDLNNLIEKQTIDYKDMQSGDPLPYKACPKCGSKNLKKGEYMDYKKDESYYVVRCKKCGWQDWTQ